MITIRCKVCQKEMTSTHKIQFCGCPNSTELIEDKITAVDLSNVVIVKNNKKYNGSNDVLTPSDLAYQEERRKRKVRKLDFEVK